MQIKPTAIPDVILVTPKRLGDHRGYFVETYHAARFREAGIVADFLQDNQSLSAAAGTVRGLHFQIPPVPQAKLVRVLQGAIYDVAVDIRIGSPTFGQWVGETLTAEHGEQLFLPHGFAHGFCTLANETIVAYKVDNYYSAAHDAGISFADPALGINWPISPEKVVISDKDGNLPVLADFASPFRYGM